MKIKGAQVANVDEVVVNESFYRKENEDCWVHKGTHQDVYYTHKAVVKMVHRLCGDNRFHVWVSGTTVNARDKRFTRRQQR